MLPRSLAVTGVLPKGFQNLNTKGVIKNRILPPPSPLVPQMYSENLLPLTGWVQGDARQPCGLASVVLGTSRWACAGTPLPAAPPPPAPAPL